MARVAGGDVAAFQTIYTACVDDVYSVALRVLHDPQQAEEVTQDVFLYLWSHATSYQGHRGRIQGWLRVIAHHRGVDVVRSQQRRRDYEGRMERSVSHSDSMEVDILGAIAASALRRSLSRLTPDHRAVLLLAYFGGYSHSEIADMLDTPVGTIKTRIRDAKIRLRPHLEQHPLTGGLFDHVLATDPPADGRWEGPSGGCHKDAPAGTLDAAG